MLNAFFSNILSRVPDRTGSFEFYVTTDFPVIDILILRPSVWTSRIVKIRWILISQCFRGGWVNVFAIFIIVFKSFFYLLRSSFNSICMYFSHSVDTPTHFSKPLTLDERLWASIYSIHNKAWKVIACGRIASARMLIKYVPRRN